MGPQYEGALPERDSRRDGNEFVSAGFEVCVEIGGMMADWTDAYRTLIDDCRKREQHISSWDADFLDSIESRLDRKIPLTEKQIGVLDGIWERATARG